jgi:hypothetical protein
MNALSHYQTQHIWYSLTQDYYIQDPPPCYRLNDDKITLFGTSHYLIIDSHLFCINASFFFIETVIIF